VARGADSATRTCPATADHVARSTRPRDKAPAARIALLAAALPLCWLMPQAGVSLWAVMAVLGGLSMIAGEIAQTLRIGHRMAMALATAAAAFGATLGAWAPPPLP
jgi:hypothetical protein